MTQCAVVFFCWLNGRMQRVVYQVASVRKCSQTTAVWWFVTSGSQNLVVSDVHCKVWHQNCYVMASPMVDIHYCTVCSSGTTDKTIHKNNSIMSHSGEVSPVILWDTLTAVMRGKIISITAYMKKLKRQRLADLQGKLKQLHLLGDVLIVLK